jgi:hypothetical protein
MDRFVVSRVSGAPVSETELIADLRSVCTVISKPSVTQIEYRQFGKYATTTQIARFGSWNKALTAASLGVYERSTSDEDLLRDLRRVADSMEQRTVSVEQYRQAGRHDGGTLTSRFGSWKKALEAAGLVVSKQAGIADASLFENILQIWQHYGRQPRRSELTKYPSTISSAPYWRRFGSWTRALECFVEFANAVEAPEEACESNELVNDSAAYNQTSTTSPATANIESGVLQNVAVTECVQRKLTPRAPSLRLRCKVLHRDNFSCCQCGRSPANVIGVVLHIDHIFPWSKGGETVLGNLQTLCEMCNLVKGDLAPIGNP